ncbi:hypothetical protein VNI00_013931 [Paramarasmius palmivorus]|uniref:Uncharacterized protein n=1 Tax=Paramarasmius palmivorus TaxID=297713 RepID=A0AAW0BVC5_9AGAR
MPLLSTFARPLSAEPVDIHTSTLSVPSHGHAPACDDLHGCRNVPGIIWSCFSVVVISTWVSIHPNVPKYGEHTVVVVIKNAVIMFMALIAPEIIVLWAMRQWFSARKITKQFKKYGWGMSHAFFVLMGGFALYDGDKFIYFLWEDWNRNPSNGEYTGEDRRLMEEIETSWRESKTEDEFERNKPSYSCLLEFMVDNEFVKVTREEIRDRSHADALSKTIAIVQTTWFILQCIARGAQGLAITELEVITLAFALLNFIVYFLWWKKPLRVRYPIRVTWKSGSRRQHPHQSHHDLPRQSVFDAIAASFSANFNRTCNTFGVPPFIVASFFPLFSLLTKFMAMLGGQNMDDGSNLFSSRLKKDPAKLYVACYAAAVGFGALHCIAWSFHFVTNVEKLQWQILSLLVTFLPVGLGVIHVSIDHKKDISDVLERWPRWLSASLTFMVAFVCFMLAVAYIVARLWLLLLAVIALRDLPTSAYRTPQWTGYIPHIG